MQQTRLGHETIRTRSVAGVLARTSEPAQTPLRVSVAPEERIAAGLKVLCVNRPRGFGGDWVTFDAFAEALQQRGARVRFTNAPSREELDWASVVHAYNVCFPWASQALDAAARAGKPLVVHAIFFSKACHPGQQGPDVLRVLNSAKAVFVYGPREIDAIRADYPQVKANFVILQKGCDTRFTAPLTTPRGTDVVMVGQIEPRKNQLRGIQACNRAGVIPFLAGPIVGDYYKTCQRAGEFIYLGNKTRDDLRTVYRSARVLLQASTYDPKPNTVIEAGLSGCRIALTQNTFYEPLPYCWVFDPLSIEAMTSAVRSALDAPSSDELQRYLLATYSWSAVVPQLLSAYEQAGWKRARL